VWIDCEPPRRFRPPCTCDSPAMKLDWLDYGTLTIRPSRAKTIRREGIMATPSQARTIPVEFPGLQSSPRLAVLRGLIQDTAASRQQCRGEFTIIGRKDVTVQSMATDTIITGLGISGRHELWACLGEEDAFRPDLELRPVNRRSISPQTRLDGVRSGAGLGPSNPSSGLGPAVGGSRRTRIAANGPEHQRRSVQIQSPQTGLLPAAGYAGDRWITNQESSMSWTGRLPWISCCPDQKRTWRTFSVAEGVPANSVFGVFPLRTARFGWARWAGPLVSTVASFAPSPPPII